MPNREIQGYRVIPIRLSKDRTSLHELFVKEHSLRLQEDDKPPGRTLFVLNIPPYVTERDLKGLFSTKGKVTHVILQNSINAEHSTFLTGYVVYSQRECLLRALEAPLLSLDELTHKMGMEKWMEEYNNSIEQPEKLERQLTAFMRNYDKAEKKKKNAKDVDEDGWTVVTRKGRNPGIANKESVKIKINDKIKQSAKRKELQNFYRFQIKEGKKKNLELLRKNYEEAKKKVNLMKSSRIFRPY